MCKPLLSGEKALVVNLGLTIPDELAGVSLPDTINTFGYSPKIPFSSRKGLYNPKAFIVHAALLRQACAMGESLTQRRRVDEEGFRVVKSFRLGRRGL